MDLTISIAGIPIKITFLGHTQKAIPLCHYYFGDFLCPVHVQDVEIKISVLKDTNNDSPVLKKIQSPILEQRLCTRDVVAWLNQVPGYEADFPINEATVSSSCLGGLLLFNPDTARGRIYLLKSGTECFRPLHRLFWMYFAQVLGERKSCFVHCAALVKNEKGYLFLGDSGAGKSSLAQTCEGSIVISDDSPILCKQNGDYLVFPSPYHQMDSLKGLDKAVVGRSARVEGLYFLTKDNRIYLEDMSKKEAVSLIIKRHILFFPYLSAEAKSALFDFFIEACNKIPYHNLHFPLGACVWDVIAGN